MKWKKQITLTGPLLIILTGLLLTFVLRGAHAQTNEIVSLLQNFEARAAAGAPRSIEEADPALEGFAKASKESVTQALPVILNDAASPYVSVRRVVASALFSLTMRPDGRMLLAPQTVTFGRLLVDSDIPIRSITALTLANLNLTGNSPLVPNLEAYLSREDAVPTIGGGIAGLLMKAAPNNAESTDAIVRYMGRKDHTAVSRSQMLQSIVITGNHNRNIGKAVASWADDPDEQTSIQAIRTLVGMGSSVVSDNQQVLSTIAADPKRGLGVRDAAAKALSGSPIVP